MWFILVLIAMLLLIPILCITGTQFFTTEIMDRYSDLPNLQMKQGKIVGFPDIRNVVYINLANRTDRKAETEAELQRMGWTPERIDAIKHDDGRVGCAMSHIKALEYAKAQKWPHVLVCEDDVRFERSPQEIQMQLNAFLLRHMDWDVILFGCTILDGEHLTPSCIRVRKSYCTHCYLIRQEYYDVLIHNFREPVQLSTDNPQADIKPIDATWHSLQHRDLWLLPFPLIATQRYEFSDIYHTDVQYNDYVAFGLKENTFY